MITIAPIIAIISVITSLILRPPCFCSSVCVQYNIRIEAEECEKRGRPGNTFYVKMSGRHEVDFGGGGGCCLTTSTGAINLRASFLPVKQSTRDLVNVWGLVWQ